jgi:hypothetical protein
MVSQMADSIRGVSVHHTAQGEHTCPLCLTCAHGIEIGDSQAGLNEPRDFEVKRLSERLGRAGLPF